MCNIDNYGPLAELAILSTGHNGLGALRREILMIILPALILDVWNVVEISIILTSFTALFNPVPAEHFNQHYY